MKRNKYLRTWWDHAQNVLWWLGVVAVVGLTTPVIGFMLKLIWVGLMFGWDSV